MPNEQVLDALRSINVPEDKARAAAISLTEYEPKIQAIDVKITALDGKFETRMVALEGKVNLLQWMVGVNTALLVALIVKMFYIA